MLSILGLFLILTIGMFVIRIAATALELTGLPYDIAAFQSLSAFTGTGFTTGESEGIVGHPMRRKIVRWLIIIGSIGVSTSLTTLMIAFAGQSEGIVKERLILLVAGVIIFQFLVRSEFLHDIIKRIIKKFLIHRKAAFIADFYEVLGIKHGHSVSKIKIDEGSWMHGKKIKDLGLDQEGTTILVVEKYHALDDKETIFFGAPTPDTMLEVGDLLTVYGITDSCNCLSQRNLENGDEMHEMRKI